MNTTRSQTRTELMRRIRAAHTTPERVLRSALWAEGLRYRLHSRAIVGRPDVVMSKVKVAIFVDGCFWHGCPRHYVRPRTRAEYWRKKLSANVTRDRKQTLALEASGWRVLRYWECEILELPVACAREVALAVRSRFRRPKRSLRVIKVSSIGPRREVERRLLVDLRSKGIMRVEVRRRTTAKVRAAKDQKIVRAPTSPP